MAVPSFLNSEGQEILMPLATGLSNQSPLPQMYKPNITGIIMLRHAQHSQQQYFKFFI